ncbi:hypothetical protein KIN20_029946 [Parelaphostrongylus tenuis]|uniref:Uncharacterized protein n=1 Tax=Parelaphostrongylus tenuis TaxID=148309 RepID=A0AAD5WGG3_PARTN|nr:hypothetical protein KIN20_029946 [Parelaphostrongylus tenuis]
MIIFESLSYIAILVLLVFDSSLLSQQCNSFVVAYSYCGTETSTEYWLKDEGFCLTDETVKVENVYRAVQEPINRPYDKVTTYVRSALLLGRFLSYAIGQLLILKKWATYWSLNIISLASLCLSLILAVAIPSVSWKTAYEKKFATKELQEGTRSVDIAPSYKMFATLHFETLIEELRKVYGNRFMMKWSMWWALATCAYLQVDNYVQTLWGAVIGIGNVDVYNGLTEALCPLVALPAVLLTWHLKVNWSKWGELCLAACSFFDCAILLLMSQTDNLIIMYIARILYNLLYETMITIAQFNLAYALENDSYGLIFGMNTFVALVLQAILTLIVASPFGLALTIRPQFEVYSGFHLVVSMIFILPPCIGLYED